MSKSFVTNNQTYPTTKLTNLGFKLRNGCWINSKLDLVVLGDQIITHKLSEKKIKEIQSEYGEEALEIIVNKIKSKQNSKSEPGFVNEKDSHQNEDLDYDYLKSLVEEYNEQRELVIYTWGKRFKKNKPTQSQHNFNASILNGRAKGIDLKTIMACTYRFKKSSIDVSLLKSGFKWLLVKLNETISRSFQLIVLKDVIGV